MKIENHNPKILEKMQSIIQQKIKMAKSQNEAALELGLSPGQIGFFRDGDWKNVSDETFNRVKAALKLNEWGTYPTNNFAMALTVAQSCQDDCRMQGLIGNTGFGKTHSLKQFAEKGKNVFYVLCDTEMTKADFRKAIANAMGMQRVDNYNKSETINAICRKLNAGNKPLLILDDVGKLSDANLRMIQIIFDKTEGNCGILLAGLPNLQKYIFAKADKDVRGFRELRRRIAYWEELKPIAAPDVKLVANENGIYDDTAIAYFIRECKDYGTLRNMITNAIKFQAKKAATVIDNELLALMNRGRMR